MKLEKKINQLLSKTSDNNFQFINIVKILKFLGFSERIKGDHHIFTKTEINEIINIQPRSDGRAKPYQIKQVRNIIQKYKLYNRENKNEK